MLSASAGLALRLIFGVASARRLFSSPPAGLACALLRLFGHFHLAFAEVNHRFEVVAILRAIAFDNGAYFFKLLVRCSAEHSSNICPVLITGSPQLQQYKIGQSNDGIASRIVMRVTQGFIEPWITAIDDVYLSAVWRAQQHTGRYQLSVVSTFCTKL